MAKSRSIPWIKSLRQIARDIKIAKANGQFIRESQLSSQFYANVRRLMLAADFDGVRWHVEYFRDESGKYSTWLMRIQAKFTPANMTCWMRAIKEARNLSSGHWRRAMVLSSYDDYTSTRAVIDTKCVEIEFRLRERAKTFCKKHRIRLVSARSRLEAINKQMIALEKEKVALKMALENMTRKYR